MLPRTLPKIALFVGLMTLIGDNAPARAQQRPNPQQIAQAQAQMAQWQQALRNAMWQYRQQMANLNRQAQQQQQQKGKQGKDAGTDYEVVFAEDGFVRTSSPPDDFDDKGNNKKLTPAEAKKLKGDTPQEQKMIGYKASFEDVRVGDVVAITVSRAKAPPKGKPADDKDEDDKPKTTWVTVGQIRGTITNIQDTGSKTFTVHMNAMPAAYGNRGGNQNGQVSLDPARVQATLIVIQRRAQMQSGFGTDKKE